MGEAGVTNTTLKTTRGLPPGVIIGLVLVCFVIGVAGVWLWSQTGPQYATQRVLDSFMRAMAVDDIAQAHSWFSSRSQAVVSVEELRSWRQMRRSTYVGYERLVVSHYRVWDQHPPGLNTPQSQVAVVEGYMIYEQGPERWFQATLEKEAGRWRITHLEVDFVEPPTGEI